MSWLTKSLTSSLGKKVLVALTGLFLCSFLVIHLIGNFQLLKNDGGEAFNLYSKFMTSNPLIKTISYLLYFSILLHAYIGLWLAIGNKSARPQGYYTVNNQSSWASRNMAILGTLILAFIIGHMGDFWWTYKFGDLPYRSYPNEFGNAQVVKDLYSIVYATYTNPLWVAFYVLSMIVISYHLQHGFQSGFQTLGLNHKKYTPFVKAFGFVFAVLIPLGFAILPIEIYFDLF